MLLLLFGFYQMELTLNVIIMSSYTLSFLLFLTKKRRIKTFIKKVMLFILRRREKIEKLLPSLGEKLLITGLTTHNMKLVVIGVFFYLLNVLFKKRKK